MMADKSLLFIYIFSTCMMYNIQERQNNPESLFIAINKSIMQFLQLDGALKMVFHIGLSKILGVQTGVKMVLAKLKEELVESTAMEL